MKMYPAGEGGEDEAAQEMQAACEPHIQRLRYDYGRDAMPYNRGYGSDPYDRRRSSYSDPRRSPYSDSHRGTADPGRDWSYEFIEGITRLAHDAVRGLGDLASRLNDLSATVPQGRSLLPGIPYLGWPFLPPLLPGTGAPHGPGTLALPSATRGGTVTGELDLENTTDHQIDVRLSCAALVGRDGDTIPGRQMSFSQNPLSLGSLARRRVRLTLEVPTRTVPGDYVGVVTAEGMQGVSCLVTVSVA